MEPCFIVKLTEFIVLNLVNGSFKLYLTICIYELSVQEETILALPNIEVLEEAAKDVHQRPFVIHILETTLIAWMKQIKVKTYLLVIYFATL